jgi:hypothetical protein
MSRFDEDLVPAKPGAPPPSAHSLVSELGVFGKPHDAQRTAVAEWLRHNPMPSDFVRRGLERKGLIDARHRSA